MIKVPKIFIMLILVISLVGCQNKAVDLKGNEKTEFGINETAVYKNVYYTVTNLEYTDQQSNGEKIADSSKTYIALTFQVKNNSKKKIPTPACILTTDKTSSEQETISWEGDATKIYINPGETINTTYYMEISKEDVAKEYDCGEEFSFNLVK